MEQYYKLPKEDVNDDDARITELHHLNGSAVCKGDLLYSFETTKTNIDVESNDDGYVFYCIELNQKINVGDDICIISNHPDFKVPKQKNDEPKGYTLTKRALSYINKNDIDISSMSLTGIVREQDIVEAISDKNKNTVELIDVLNMDSELTKRLMSDENLKDLDSTDKIKLYRDYGHDVDDSVIFEEGSIVIGNRIAIGSNVIIGQNTIIESPSIHIGNGTRIGRNCDFVASKIHLGPLNRVGNDVVVDISGGRYPDSDLVTGRDCLIAGGSFINVCRKVKIGDHVALSPRSMLFTHSFWQSVLEGYSANFGPITIDNDSWVGAAAQVLPNTRIGTGVIVMSGSVVTSNVNDFSMVGGVPAKLIRDKVRKRLTDKQIQNEFNKLLNEFLCYLGSMNYHVFSTTSNSTEITLLNGKKRSLEFIFDGAADFPEHNDIVLVYKNSKSVSASSVLCVHERSIINTNSDPEQLIVDYFRRRGVLFYGEH